MCSTLGLIVNYVKVLRFSNSSLCTIKLKQITMKTSIHERIIYIENEFY